MIDLGDQRYRRFRFRADRRLAMVIAAMGCAACVFFARNDVLLFAGTPTLRILLLSRLMVALINVPALWLMARARTAQRFDRAFAAAAISVALTSIVVGVTRIRLGVLAGQLIANVFHMSVLYFALRGALWPRAGAALVVSVSTLLVVFSPASGVSPVTRGTLVCALVVFNAAGLYSAYSQDSERRRRFDAERSARLAHRRLDAKIRELAAQREQALALARARTAFLATMSHEFRTPMNAVIGLSELLAEAPLSEEHGRHARTIRDSARGLLSLLDDILDFTKIDAEKLTLLPTRFELRPLVASVTDMMRPGAAARSLEIAARVAEEVPACALIGDETRLRQVLVNLLSNAVKFTERGAILLEVTARPLDEGRCAVTFRVVDTGIGIAPSMLPRMFHPFEQADQGSARRFGGSGLGLAISSRIVKAMGGDLHVESQVGQGSTFWFVLPLPLAPGASDPLRSEPAPAPAPTRLAILVVDDHAINREVALVALRRLGHTAELASDGPAAISLARARRFDVIFMDVHMPGMDGIEATQRILARDPAAPPPYVVAMSASVLEADQAACFTAGMRGFLGKPIDLRALSEVLRRAAAAQGTGDEAELRGTALEALRTLEADGEPGFIGALHQRFIADTTERLALMRTAAERRDVATLAHHAHLLASTSGTFGATALRERLLQIEAAAEAREPPPPPDVLEELDAEFHRVRRTLERVLGPAQGVHPGGGDAR